MATDNKFPSFDDICRKAEAFVEQNPGIARMESLGTSPEGREVLAVEVTDVGVPLEQKQVAFVVCGRHGDELGTRVVGPAVLNWLASEDAAETRRRQLVVVVPVANPDGCVREEFFAPSDGLSETEDKTIAALAERYRPDAVVDVHSLGPTGHDYEMVITAHTTRCGEDQFVHNLLATKMVQAAARQGYPFGIHAVGLTDGYNNFFSGICYEHFHSVVFGMEVNHFALTPDETAASGAAAIRGLLEAGNRRFGWQCHEGYPNEILIGDFSTSVRPVGKDAAARRQSRAGIWQNRTAFTTPKREMPDLHTLKVTTEYSGDPLPVGWALCCRVRGKPVIRSVRLNQRKVDSYCCSDECSTYVFVDIEPSGPERYELTVEL